MPTTSTERPPADNRTHEETPAAIASTIAQLATAPIRNFVSCISDEDNTRDRLYGQLVARLTAASTRHREPTIRIGGLGWSLEDFRPHDPHLQPSRTPGTFAPTTHTYSQAARRKWCCVRAKAGTNPNETGRASTVWV